MNTKRILVSVVTGALLTGSLLAAEGNDRARHKTTVRASKPTAATTVRTGGNVRTNAVRTRYATRTGGTVRTDAPRTRYVTRTSNNSRVVGTTGTPVRTRVVTRSGSYPYYGGYRYGYSGYGYPYYGYSGYSYGPSISFGFGSPYYYNGYYPYDNYGYGYNSYPYNYNYGSYYYNNSYGYGNGSVVIAVQSRLARMGYYHGPVDGIMGPGTSFAIRAYERDHGLRVDGAISGSLARNMGIRY